ncbi:head-tail adaptor protein [Phenylobacterium sp.]|uniref:head-tail adaptor protein n=1 Tax=Phenylobacterium sp. TaxID=1871053 RepID=UPI00301D2505
MAAGALGPLGSLDRTVAFQRPIVRKDALGEAVPAGWETFATVMGRRTPVSDGERVAAAQVQRVITDRFVTHWSAELAGLDLTQQVLCEGLTYALVSRKELGRRSGLEWSAMARPVEPA